MSNIKYDPDDIDLMKRAVDLAKQCSPVKEGIPKVGAVIAVRGVEIASGKRGSGNGGDDEHAEFNAFSKVEDKERLPGSSLYTTLEPCTSEVRSEPFKACTELILRHRIKKVFIGILDPNQNVTGKGLLKLQKHGVEVSLFPVDFSDQVLAINDAFIRSHETLSAEIVSPVNGAELKTYETGGVERVRFKALKKPSNKTHLLILHEGQCFPQPIAFNQVGTASEAGVWEIPAHFGTTGQYRLVIATTTSDLADALIGYYWLVVERNQNKRNRLWDKVEVDDRKLLDECYYGIPMPSLPKGFRVEAAVNVQVVPKSQ